MGMQIKKFREAAGLSQEQLADASGIKLGTLRSWEQGKATVKLSDACLLCNVLGCTPNDLCDWYAEHPQQMEQMDVTHDERVLIGEYRRCTPDRQRVLASMARDLAGISQTCGDASPPYDGIAEAV